MQEKIVILDFGSQTTQLIGRYLFDPVTRMLSYDDVNKMVGSANARAVRCVREIG
jgi:GMP synthase-like glutamine amidotransferase